MGKHNSLRKLINLFLRYRGWQLLYVSFVGIGLFLSLASRVYDDPFITYRYADNIRNGFGFVYNLGEHTLSTTTPLFALLLALVGNLWPDLQILGNLIGAVSLALGGLCLWELGRTWKSPLVGWSGLLLYPTFPLLLITLGSETPLFLTLVLGAFLLYSKQRYGPSVLLLALSILTRSDGILIALVLGCHYLWINRTQLNQSEFWRDQPWGWFVSAIGLLVVWHTFAWIYFGSPLPVTLAAKQAQGRMAISQLFAPGLLRVASWYSNGWQNWVELGLFGIGVIFAFLKKHKWLLIIVWTGLYFGAYTLLGVTRYFWYYAPLVPGWVVAVGLGFSFLYWVPLPTRLRKSPLWNRLRVGAIILLLTTIFFIRVINVHNLGQRNDPRYIIYRAVGEWLALNTPDDASVGALEVGMIGYFSQRSMVDFAGLIQPDVADQMETDTTYEDTAIWAVRKYQPEYLVLMDGAHPRLKADIVALFCQRVEQFAGSQYSYSSDIQIYVCQFD